MDRLIVPGDSNFNPSKRLSEFGGMRSNEMSEVRKELIKNGAVSNEEVINEMRSNRRVNQKTGFLGGNPGGGGSAANFSFATGRPRDPTFYWRQNNFPFDVGKDEELKKVREFMRLLYLTHPVIASAVDIFSKFPILGLSFQCKDDALVDFYGSLFLEDGLDYEEFLIDVGREYWLVGEAFPLGSFSEDLGVWEADELINPDDVTVIRSPFLKEPRFEMKLPEVMRDIIKNREPRYEYEALMNSYPELAHFTQEDSRMAVSNILLKQLKFKGDSFHPRGLPILMRGMRSVIQEEMLNSAQDAIAERLSTPLLLAKLGASASDLGTTVPWVPTQTDLLNFEEALDAALAADFRVLIHHFALTIENVLGKEVIPDFNDDFDRLTEKQLQVFGLSKTMLSGADQGETYAGDALNRDLVIQLMGSWQKKCKKFLKDRMMVVAEAQGHYDYEERNGVKYPIYEEVLVTDPESGEQSIIEQPKLLVPDVTFKTLNLADEETRAQWIEAIRTAGVPISQRTRVAHKDIDLEDEMEVTKNEQVEQAVKNQEVRRETYLRLKAEGLPIPADIRTDFEPKAQEKGGGNPNAQDAAEEEVMPSLGLDQPAPTMGLVPTPADIDASQAEDAPNDEGVVNAVPVQITPPSSPSGIKLPQNKFKSRPDESSEKMKKMPKDSALIDEPKEGLLQRGPSHIGKRSTLHINKDKPLNEQDW